ncbi:MAG: TlpA family protein disulfide reductase [Bacteroidetes bacterium]|nr:MAG: TlpA family protein disulfide reductase [Bacteroidota bacterium]
MTFNPKKLLSNYFKKKKPFGIITDLLFVVLLLLFVIPATRKDTAAFFIRLTSFSASTLDSDEQFAVNFQTLDWQLYDLQGNNASFESLNDKPIFLNIWATWCPPCIAEMPSIQALYEDYGDKVNFIIVSNEAPQKVQHFAKDQQYEGLPFYLSASLPHDFSTNSIPATFIVSSDGRVLVSKKGAARWNSGTTRDLLDKLINE